jgi:hypothetical protein
VSVLPVTTFILAETKTTVKRDANPTIQEFKKKNEITSNHDLQTYFNMKLIPMLKKHNKRDGLGGDYDKRHVQRRIIHVERR